MKIHYHDRSELPAEIAGDAIYHKDPSDLLRVSQFLSLHAPETPQTRHFLNTKAISLLPAGAIVVNTARGGLVVDDELITALKSGRVAAAGLDVFEGEPKLNPEYVSLKNTFLLPHIGSATIETRTAMGMLALDNVDAVLNGRPRRRSSLIAVGKLPEPLGGNNERTLEGSDRRRGIWRAFRGSTLEIRSSGRDAYRSAKLSPFPTAPLSSRNGLAFGGRGCLAPSECPKPAEKYSRLVGDRRGDRSGLETRLSGRWGHCSL